MFGCLGRLGCLVMLLIVGLIAALTRSYWGPRVGFGDRPASSAIEGKWEPVTPQRAATARAAFRRLGNASGPVFVNLTAAEVASFLLDEVGKSLTQDADSVRATVVGDRLMVRANVPLKALGGTGVLGPLAGMLKDREPLELGGTFRVVRPGLGEFDVQEVRVRNFPVPRSALPRLLRQLSRVPRPEGISETGLPVPLPEYLGDVRIANGRITLYRTVAERR